MYCCNYKEGFMKWHVIKLAGGRIIHASFLKECEGQLRARVKIGFPLGKDFLQFSTLEHDSSFKFIDMEMDHDYSQLEMYVEDVVDHLEAKTHVLSSPKPARNAIPHSYDLLSGMKKSKAFKDTIVYAVISMAYRFLEQGNAITAADLQVSLGFSLERAQGILTHLVSKGKLVKIKGIVPEMQPVPTRGAFSGFIPTIRENTQVKYVTVPAFGGKNVDVDDLAVSMACERERWIHELDCDENVHRLALEIARLTHAGYRGSTRRISFDTYLNEKVTPALVRYLIWNRDQSVRYNYAHAFLWNDVPSFFNWSECAGDRS